MNNIIYHLLILLKYQQQQIAWLLNFICRYIPLKQWVHEDSSSPKYQKFKIDPLPIITYHEHDWNYNDLISHFKVRYGKTVRPIRRQSECGIPDGTACPKCAAPKPYLYENNGEAGQLECKVCATFFSPDKNRFAKTFTMRCPYCGCCLSRIKKRIVFIIHKCVNDKCPYYLNNLDKVDERYLLEPYGKNNYKLRYIYREFTVDFFRMALNPLPDNVSSLKFSKFNAHIVGLALTYHVNHQISLRKTALLLLDVHGISISHQQIANFARIAAICIKPFVDNFNYPLSGTYVGDETYIKIRGVKSFVWFIMDAVSRSITGYQVSDRRDVGPCIMAMRMAFRQLSKLPEKFRFIADGYSAYSLAAMQFAVNFGDEWKFDITQVIGLTNDDATSREFRPYKQLVERLNRTFKGSYRVSCGYDNIAGANYNVSLWVAYYNFLRPHTSNRYRVLNKVPMIDAAENMPGKWQLLIYLGQKTIAHLQTQGAGGSGTVVNRTVE